MIKAAAAQTATRGEPLRIVIAERQEQRWVRGRRSRKGHGSYRIQPGLSKFGAEVVHATRAAQVGLLALFGARRGGTLRPSFRSSKGILGRTRAGRVFQDLIVRSARHPVIGRGNRRGLRHWAANQRQGRTGTLAEERDADHADILRCAST